MSAFFSRSKNWLVGLHVSVSALVGNVLFMSHLLFKRHTSCRNHFGVRFYFDGTVFKRSAEVLQWV